MKHDADATLYVPAREPPTEREAKAERPATNKRLGTPQSADPVDAPAFKRPSASAVQPSARSGSAPALGTLIRGRFELESVLGEGSMGVVYRALDRLHLEMHDRNPYVAIKILSEEFKRRPNALITLQREVRKAQTLTHENIIGVHTFDRDGPIVYMTMELLDGQELRAVIAERALVGLRPSEAVPLIRAMARALAYAHANGIVHCDFKPGNVFLTRKGQIKVLDFGVARAAPSTCAAETEPTRAELGEASGMTPAYASLQILEGEDPTPADDVFSLAIVAYELLTGRHPFDRSPADSIRLRNLHEKAPPGLTRSQRKALLRAFAADRDARHRTAGEFLEEFDGKSSSAALAGGGIAAVALVPLAVFFATRGPEGPTVPFESLPSDVQATVEAALAEGDTALAFGAAGVNDAFQYFSEAYELHPGNERAELGLEAVANRFLESLEQADEATRHDVFSVLYCQDYLTGYAPVTAACAELLGAEQCGVIAAGCRTVSGK